MEGNGMHSNGHSAQSNGMHQGTVDPDLAAFLSALSSGKNVMIAGAVSAGRTTLLRALASEIDPLEGEA